MQFVVTSHQLNYIVVPVQITSTINKFHHKMREHFPNFFCNRANNGLFDYSMPNARFWNDTTYVGPPYAKLMQHAAVSPANNVRKCLGPKGIDLRVFFKPNDAEQGHQLLDDILTKLPLNEMGAAGEKKPATDADIYQWYTTRCEEFATMERWMNEQLSGITFPQK